MREARANRLVVVGQGDLPSHRLDKLMLVDYDTEAVLLELPPDALAGKIYWKPLVQSQWIKAAAPAGENGAIAAVPRMSAPPVANGEDSSISNALSAWARAEESNDPATLADCYAAEMDRYFLRRHVSREYVRDYLTNLFRRDSRRVVTFVPKVVAFEDQSPDEVKVRLMKDVLTTDQQGTVEHLIRSVLYLKKEGSQWKIFSEQDLK